MLTPSPIDFVAVRRAIVASIAQATGLSNTQIIRQQGAGPVQPPPKRPYASFQLRTIGMRAGQDWILPAPDVGPTFVRYGGDRGMSVDVNFYADDQDQAYGLCLAYQCGLSLQPIRELLESSELSVWTIGDATDVTALLSSGFEARAFLEYELWTSVTTLVDLSSMDAVAIAGTVYNVDDTPLLFASTTVEAGS